MVRKLASKLHNGIKVAVFLITLIVALYLCNYILKPIYIPESYTAEEFYKEPRNSIETIFLGASTVMRGINPMELYEDYGISSYNLATSRQYMIASYYWLKESYRLQSDSMDTVVLDVSGLFSAADRGKMHRAFDGMHLSAIKLQAVSAYSTDFEEFVSELVPILTYHDRWAELTQKDFIKKYNPLSSNRGYFLCTKRYVDEVDNYESIALPFYLDTGETQKAELDNEALDYFNKIISFCNEHNLKLVLIKTPTDWDASQHNAVQAIADDNDLDFLDFNMSTYYDELGYNFATDSMDNVHANSSGASKITSYLGKYLIQECNNRDIRTEQGYAFLQEELESYNKSLLTYNLSAETDPGNYLSCLMNQKGYITFVSVKDEAARSLTQEQRDCFASIGLEKLSTLTYRASYLAVIDDGDVVAEFIRTDPINDSLGNMDESSLVYNSTLPDGINYRVTSGGYNLGNVSSIIINGEEYSPNETGLNIVVYDKNRFEVADSVVFNTDKNSKIDTRDYEMNLEDSLEKGVTYQGLSGKERILYQYDRAGINQKFVLNVKKKDDDKDLFSYLKDFFDNKDYTIYLAVKGNAADIITDNNREKFKELGLTELSQLAEGDSYLAVINGGDIIVEEKNNGNTPVKLEMDDVSIISGGYKSGDTVSIKIDGIEYTDGQSGINIVVSDSYTGQFVDSIVFETDMNIK